MIINSSEIERNLVHIQGKTARTPIYIAPGLDHSFSSQLNATFISLHRDKKAAAIPQGTFNP